MSKPKWQPGVPLTREEFYRLDPYQIIYDTIAHRATTAGILWGMTYRTLLIMFRGQRYFTAIPIKENVCQTKIAQL